MTPNADSGAIFVPDVNWPKRRAVAVGSDGRNNMIAVVIGELHIHLSLYEARDLCELLGLELSGRLPPIGSSGSE